MEEISHHILQASGPFCLRLLQAICQKCLHSNASCRQPVFFSLRTPRLSATSTTQRGLSEQTDHHLTFHQLQSKSTSVQFCVNNINPSCPLGKADSRQLKAWANKTLFNYFVGWRNTENQESIWDLRGRAYESAAQGRLSRGMASWRAVQAPVLQSQARPRMDWCRFANLSVSTRPWQSHPETWSQ